MYKIIYDNNHDNTRNTGQAIIVGVGSIKVMAHISYVCLW
jgi:hypothetical protein